MKVRILSDVHADLNKHYEIPISKSDIFTVFAGDISGDPEITIDFVKKHAERGIVVAGNHIVYNKRGLAIEEYKRELADAFPQNGPITFLDAMTGCVSKVVNGILFVGSTMYTDYLLGIDEMRKWKTSLKREFTEDDAIELNIDRARPRMSSGMNDFCKGKTRIGSAVGEPRYLKPEDYLKWHNETMEMFEQVLSINELADKLPVVMVSHHAPSGIAVEGDIDHYRLQASYASDKHGFVYDHPLIKAWIYGHIHMRKSFNLTIPKTDCVSGKVDAQTCVFVNNAYGYAFEVQNVGFADMCLLDTDTWNITNDGKLELDGKCCPTFEELKKYTPFL